MEPIERQKKIKEYNHFAATAILGWHLAEFPRRWVNMNGDWEANEGYDNDDHDRRQLWNPCVNFDEAMQVFEGLREKIGHLTSLSLSSWNDQYSISICQSSLSIKDGRIPSPEEMERITAKYPKLQIRTSGSVAEIPFNIVKSCVEAYLYVQYAKEDKA